MIQVRGVSCHRRAVLSDQWELASAGGVSLEGPEQLLASNPRWVPAQATTVASVLRASGEWDLTQERDFDAEEWWFRCRFAADPRPGAMSFLEFGGLATVADAWLNGTPILHSENMFVEHAPEVTSLLRPANELYLRFSSLQAELGKRRPRPRWRVRLVKQQQLRWLRTTLLGRIPGWSPPAAPVGPWRPVVLEERRILEVLEADVRPTMSKQGGEVAVRLRLESLQGQPLAHAELFVAGQRAKLQRVEGGEREVTFSGSLRVPGAERWWPHTHGAQPLYPVKVAVTAGGELCEVDLGRIGFRTVERVGGDESFGFAVNGVPVFARGACWTTTDVVGLRGDREQYRRALTLARDAGMNMLRIGGAFHYEEPEFYDLCDELGILVWQDFMFASLDYPLDDEAFRANVEAEVAQQLARLAAHPSLAMLCGNSEVDQQRAMLGLGGEYPGAPFFHQRLAELCQERCPQVPYRPSSATLHGVRVDRGAVHYYGVGAYLRPLEDARRSGVRFASECLAFANVPEQTSVDTLLADGEAPFHHPLWKRRVPRDVGTGWDFDDVRDHYLQSLFGVSPPTLRSRDMEQYLALSRVVTGEVMAAAFGEWRRQQSMSRGALIWFLQDLWLGAGWGVVDALGIPKPCYYFLKRVLQPVAIAISDEGLNGLVLHLFNEGAGDLVGEVSLALYRQGEVSVATGVRAVTLPARGGLQISANDLLEGFFDSTYSYHFGPPGHDVAVARLTPTGGSPLEAFHFPLVLPLTRLADIGLTAAVERSADGELLARISTRRFAQSVHLAVPGYLPDDNHFHLGPSSERRIPLRRSGESSGSVTGTVHALNLEGAVRLREGS